MLTPAINQFRPLDTIVKLYKTNGMQRVKERIRQRIIADNLHPGDQLLPERELATIYKASRTMIRAILDELEAEKIIERKQGKGTFVTGVVAAASSVKRDTNKLKFSSERYFSFYPSIRTELKFYTMDCHPVQKEFWLQVIKGFTATEIAPVFGDEVSPDILAENLSGFDVVQLAPFQAGMVPDSKLVDLTPMVEKDKIALDRFLDSGLRPCVKNGFIRGLPFTLSFSGILVVNKELTGKANKTIPDRFTNLEHFLRWCSELTSALREDESVGSPWGTNLHNYSYYVLSEMATGFFLKRPIDTFALRKHLSLILQYRGKAYESAYRAGELYEQFLHGGIVVFPGNTLDLLFLRNEAEFPWTIRAMPREDSERYYAISLINCIPADTQYKEEAWEFIKYLSSPGAQHLVAGNRASMPALEAEAFSEAYLTKDPFRRQTLLDVLRNGADIMDIQPADRVMVPRKNVNDLWRELFKENRTNEEILSGIVGLADRINQKDMGWKHEQRI